MALAISTVLVISLTACGDGNGGEVEDVVTPVEAQPMLSELELEILNLETKYNKGEFTGADYLALADAYSRAGDIRKQRDMLEQDYRLYEDADAFSTLQGLSVNLEEETEEIRSRAQEMLNDLELPEYLDESVNLVDSGDWFSTMMPKLKEGQRSYYLERDAQPLFYAQVGYTGEGQRFSKVWYTGSETKRFLSQEGTIIRLVTVTSTVAGAEDPTSTAGTDTTAETADIQDTATPRAATPADMGAWNGTFESWSVDCATGSITHEQGTMQKGVLTGDYTCDVHAGEGGLDAFSLWNNREGMEYITYTGSFDSEGKALVEQPSEEIRKKLLEGTDDTDLILYAYDATGENCLWQGTGAETSVADYRFGGELIGLETRPEYTSYEVPETMATDDDGTGSTGETGTEKPQIRIFDGEIQWFDGKYWVSAGNVKEMAKQDPFAAYEENHDTAAPGDTAGTTGGDTTEEMPGRALPEAIPPEQLAATKIPERFRSPRQPRSLRQSRPPQNPVPPNLLQLRHPLQLRYRQQPQHRRRAMTTAAPAVAVTVEAPEETAAAAAEVTWIWSGHRICCSPAHAIDHIGLFRGSPENSG